MKEIAEKNYEDFKKLIEDVVNALGDDKSFLNRTERCSDKGINRIDNGLYFWVTFDLTDEEYCRIRNKIINFVWFDTRRIQFNTRYGDIKATYSFTRGFGNEEFKTSYRDLRFMYYKTEDAIEIEINFI